MNAPKQIGEIVRSVNTAELVTRFDSDIALANKRSDAFELSVFEGLPPASEVEVIKEINKLKSVYTELQNSFWATLMMVIHDSGISEQRLNYCVTRFLLTHTYGKSFTPAELLSIDKKIVIAKSMSALRNKVKHPLLSEDIVMVYYDNEKRFALATDAESYGLNIIARYHGKEYDIEWVGHIDSPDMPQRKRAFGECIGEFLGKYPRKMLLAFYNYWTVPVRAGDVMRFEAEWYNTYTRDDGTIEYFLDSRLERYEKIYNEEKMK